MVASAAMAVAAAAQVEAQPVSHTKDSTDLTPATVDLAVMVVKVALVGMAASLFTTKVVRYVNRYWN